MKNFILSFLIFAVATLFAACQSAETGKQTTSPPTASVSETKPNEISSSEARAAIENSSAQFIDVRTEAEYAGGHAPKAVNFPLDELTKEIGKLDKSKPVYVICQSGARSKKAAETLIEAGFRQVFSIAGGTTAWTSAGFPIEKSSVNSDSDEKRSREIKSGGDRDDRYQNGSKNQNRRADGEGEEHEKHEKNERGEREH